MVPETCGGSTERAEKAQTFAVMTRVSASKETETRSVSQRSFSITPVPPFRLDLTAWALRRRPENAIDRWDGTTYQRVLMIDRQAVDVAVHQCGGPEEPQLEVELTGSRLTVQQEDFARMSLERMLGVHRDLKPFYRLANARSKIAVVSRRIPRAQAAAVSHGIRSSGQRYRVSTTLSARGNPSA